MKKKIKSKSFVLDIEPYSQQCIVVINGKFKDAKDLFKKNIKNPRAREVVEHLEKDKSEEYSDSFSPQYGCAYLYTALPHSYVMMISNGESFIDTVGSICHESLHLTHYILRKAGLELAKESEEAYTYLQEKILEDILKQIY